MRSAATLKPFGAINSIVMFARVNNTRSAPSPEFCQAGARPSSV